LAWPGDLWAGRSNIVYTHRLAGAIHLRSRITLQVRAREEELTNLASLHASTKAAADKRIADLEARASRLQDSNRQLEQRRQLEVDGWGADVTLLRKQLAAVDRKLTQMRLIDRYAVSAPRDVAPSERIVLFGAGAALHQGWCTS
jgi:hypothetical protein